MAAQQLEYQIGWLCCKTERKHIILVLVNIGKAKKRKRGTFEWLLNKRTGLSSLRKFKFKFSVLCIFAGSSQKNIFSPKDTKNVVVEKFSN